MRKHKSLVLLIALLVGAMINPVLAEEVNAAVSANFAIPMQQIADLFQKESGYTVKLSFGSSGKFYSQIKEGALFDVFLSADEKYPKHLEQEGFTVPNKRFVYALGKLVLWSSRRGYVDDKGAVLRKVNYNTLAYADPKLAPYGLAAKDTLEVMGLWNDIQDKLVRGENIAQTYQSAATGEADMAFVALSQIMHDGKLTEGSWWLVPSYMYSPIRQSAVLLSVAKDKVSAKAFLVFLKSEKAKTIIRNFGYELP
jgi:molybdate transport system substrate-binding protein